MPEVAHSRIRAFDDSVAAPSSKASTVLIPADVRGCVWYDHQMNAATLQVFPILDAVVAFVRRAAQGHGFGPPELDR